MTKILIVGLCLSLFGCASIPKPVKPFDQPRYGMTKQQLVDMFGEPDSIEIYQKSDKTRIEFDTYVRIYQSFQEKVPVCLVNKRVVGWGKSFYEDHFSTDDIKIK